MTKTIKVYCDGSALGTPGPAGYGVYCDDPQFPIEISHYIGTATNNVAELCAAIRAMEAFDPSVNLEVITDSQYAINVITEKTQAHANLELVNFAKNLLRTRKGQTTFTWTKGHDEKSRTLNSRGNKKTDELAGRASASRSPFVPTPAPHKNQSPDSTENAAGANMTDSDRKEPTSVSDAITTVSNNTPAQIDYALSNTDIRDDFGVYFTARKVPPWFAYKIGGARLVKKGDQTFEEQYKIKAVTDLIAFLYSEDYARVRHTEDHYYKGGSDVADVSHTERKRIPLDRYKVTPGRAVPYLRCVPEWARQDTTVPIIITEGSAKALSVLWNLWMPAIGLGGVEAGWHDVEHKDRTGQWILNAEMKQIGWKGRTVYIGFDANRWSRAAVARAEARLAKALQKEGAIVKIVELPSPDKDPDIGPDDWMNEYGSPEQYKALVDAAIPAGLTLAGRTAAERFEELPFKAALFVATPAEREEFIEACKKAKPKIIGVTPAAIKNAVKEVDEIIKGKAQEDLEEVIENGGSKYEIEGGCICLRAINGSIPLCNFTAQITHEIHFDDGYESSSMREDSTKECIFEVEGKDENGRSLGTARVPAENFADMKWVLPNYGSKAIIGTGKETKDLLRHAILTLSNAKKETVYTHTGWRKINGQWDYLYHGGTVSDNNSVRVELGAADARLKNYNLPPANPATLSDDIAMSLKMLHLAPFATMYPLLGATYLGPLASMIEPGVMVWVVAPTHSFKTEFLAQVQAHYGAKFFAKNLPESWKSTKNKMEYTLHILKDVVCTIDDFAPQMTERAQHQLMDAAEGIVRGNFNGAGRGRLGADGKPKKTYTPRGVVVSTGEQLPADGATGESILNRLVICHLDKETVNCDVLTELQNNHDALARAMRGFIEWIAPQYDALSIALKKKYEAWKLLLRGKMGAGASRNADSLAGLAVALETFFDYADSQGVDTDLGRVDEIGRQFWTPARDLIGDALMLGAKHQAQTQSEVNPAVHFMKTLSDLFTMNRVALAPNKKMELNTGIGRPEIGWIDGDKAYVLPAAAKAAVTGHMIATKEQKTINAAALNEALRAKGFVTSWDKSSKRLECQITAGGKSGIRVWEIPLHFLYVEDKPSPEEEAKADAEKAAKRAERVATLHSVVARQEQAEMEAASTETERKYRVSAFLN